jgi:hypothetical protein
VFQAKIALWCVEKYAYAKKISFPSGVIFRRNVGTADLARKDAKNAWRRVPGVPGDGRAGAAAA